MIRNFFLAVPFRYKHLRDNVVPIGSKPRGSNDLITVLLNLAVRAISGDENALKRDVGVRDPARISRSRPTPQSRLSVGRPVHRRRFRIRGLHRGGLEGDRLRKNRQSGKKRKSHQSRDRRHNTVDARKIRTCRTPADLHRPRQQARSKLPVPSFPSCLFGDAPGSPP